MATETEYLIITDPEGCGEIFKGGPTTRYHQSPLLCKGTTLTALENWINGNTTIEKNKELAEIRKKLKDNILVRKIVFCGDYFDNGSVEQIKTFLNTVYTLKINYREKIIILLGNRDLNKLRLVRENKFNSEESEEQFLNRQEYGETPTYNEKKRKNNIPPVFPNLQDEYDKFNFYQKTMGISLGLKSVSEINKDTQGTSLEKEMVVFLKYFWKSKEELNLPFTMLDFFQKCEIIHVDNGIVFAHGGFNIEMKIDEEKPTQEEEQFDRDLLKQTDLDHLKIYYDYLLENALEYVNLALIPQSDGAIIEKKMTNLQKNKEIERKINSLLIGQEESLINFYENVIEEISKMDLKYPEQTEKNIKNDQQFYYDLSANLNITL